MDPSNTASHWNIVFFFYFAGEEIHTNLKTDWLVFFFLFIQIVSYQRGTLEWVNINTIKVIFQDEKLLPVLIL